MTENLHILVVDDSAAIQQQLCTMLSGKGFLVSGATTLDEARQMLSSTRFTLVLADITMDGMAGLNLIKEIRQNHPTIGVVVVTGNASSYVAIKALRLGAFDFIVKPIDDEAMLSAVLDRTMEKLALTRENEQLIETLYERNRELHETILMMQALNTACAMLASTLDTGEILSKLVESAVQQLRAKKGYLLLLDRSGRQFTMKVGVGIDRTLARHFSLPSNQGIAGLVAANTNSLRLTGDIPTHLTAKMLEEDLSGLLFSTPGLLCVPLQLDGRVIGVVTISGRTDGRPFSQVEEEFLTTLANHATIAIANAGQIYRLKKSST